MRKWKVYENGYFAGETYAVSEAKAINNVRYRLHGKFYQDNTYTAVEVDESKKNYAAVMSLIN